MGWIHALFGKKAKQQTPDNTKQSYEAGNIRAVVLSDLGNIRTNNEDKGMFYKVADENIVRDKGCLLIVADGMGGHNAGEVASQMAADIISREYFKQPPNGSIEKALEKVFTLANKNIFQMSSSQKAYSGMGTTCTAIVVVDQAIYFAHVGDSRAYLQRGDSIMQITEDHTYVQQLVNSGDITAEEAAVHPQRNVLTNAMGTKADLRIDTGKFKFNFENNDRLLLCSDGLYDYLNDQELKDILNHNALKNAAEYMIQQAKARGGHDNITVVVAEKATPVKEQAEKETKDFELPQTRETDLP